MTDKTKLDKCTAMIKQGYLENKINMIPTSVKETFSELDAKNPVLLSRELIVNNRVVLGAEYAPDGHVVKAYTTDEKGKKIEIDRIDDNIAYENYNLKDMISEHLQKAVQMTTKDKEPNSKVVSETKTKKTIRKVDTPTRRIVKDASGRA